MRSHAPFEPIVTKFCMWGWVVDVITESKFYGNRLRGFRVTGPLPQTPFPILHVLRPYNSVSTTVLHCDLTSPTSTNATVTSTDRVLVQFNQRHVLINDVDWNLVTWNCSLFVWWWLKVYSHCTSWSHVRPIHTSRQTCKQTMSDRQTERHTQWLQSNSHFQHSADVSKLSKSQFKLLS